MTSTTTSAPFGFMVHNEGDHVGVAVEDVGIGRFQAYYMDSRREVDVEALEAIPLGHKIALKDLPADSDVIEYGVRVAKTRRAIKRGELVHVHNVRSARWEASQ